MYGETPADVPEFPSHESLERVHDLWRTGFHHIPGGAKRAANTERW